MTILFNEMNKEKKICEYRVGGICKAKESITFTEKCTSKIHRECFHPDAEGCC